MTILSHLAVCVLLSVLLASAAHGWTKKDLSLYQKRRFTELEHILIVRRATEDLRLIRAQEKDLVGCRHIRRGQESLNSFVECLQFLSREEKLKLFTNGRQEVIASLNIICAKIALRPGFLDKILDTSLLNKPFWEKCSEATWRQVYLTVYANFDARPIKTLALVGKAKTGLGFKAKWAQKTLDFLRKNTELSND